MQPLISFVIIGFNSKKFLETCFDSIFAQSYEPIEVIFIDNASSDESVAWVTEAYAKYVVSGDAHGTYADAQNSAKDASTGKVLVVVANTENKGYAGAANQGIFMAKGDYVVITNPDIIYEPDYFEKAVAEMERDPTIGALTGKVKKYDFAAADRGAAADNAADAAAARGQTNLIDTVGLCVFRSRRVIDDGQGLVDDGRFDHARAVFGVSGACPLYRKKALEDAKLKADMMTCVDHTRRPTEYEYEYLDNDFFMYKEDVDLAWRLRLLGWKAQYMPSALAWHGRGTGVKQRFTTGQVLKERDTLSPFQKSFSFTNQHLMQVKNDLWGNILRDLPWIIARELATLAYITIKEPFLWKSVIDFFKLLPSALRKRRQIMVKREVAAHKVPAAEMQQWFVGKSDYV